MLGSEIYQAVNFISNILLQFFIETFYAGFKSLVTRLARLAIEYAIVCMYAYIFIQNICQ